MNINIRDTKFLNYNIRSCVIDDVEMFLVSDLLRQYNEINNTNKRFIDYLKNKQTQELLRFYKNDTVGENSHLPYENNERWDIFKIIHYITLPVFDNGANKGYIVSEQLLIACLMWCDPVFATQIYDFIKNMREINNDRFTEILNSNEEKDNQINLLQEQVDDLKSRYNNAIVRYTPEEYNYFFTVAHNELTNVISTVITKEQYEPFDKNIKRLYNLKCCNPLVLQEKLISMLSDDVRFKQVSNNEFIIVNPETTTTKSLFWMFKNKCKKIRKELNWQTGL